MFNNGDFLTLVFNEEGNPRVANARVEAVEPLTVLVPSSDWTHQLSSGARVSLVSKGEHGGAHSDGTITEITKYGLSLVIEMSGVEWSPFDRRRAPRFPVSLDCELTVVSENSGLPEFHRLNASVIDISAVGCRIAISQDLQPSVLIAAAIHIPNAEPLRMLSVVTRTFDIPEGCALEFFDFVGTTRFRLDEYISSLPQAA